MAGVSGQIEAGQLLLPQDAPWMAEFKTEILGFPHGRHDDRTDPLSKLIMWVRHSRAIRDSQTIAGPIIFTLNEFGGVDMVGDEFHDENLALGSPSVNDGWPSY